MLGGPGDVRPPARDAEAVAAVLARSAAIGDGLLVIENGVLALFPGAVRTDAWLSA